MRIKSIKDQFSKGYYSKNFNNGISPNLFIFIKFSFSVHIFIGAGSCMLKELSKFSDSFQPSHFYIFWEMGSAIAPSLGAFGGFYSSIISLFEAHVDTENILLLDSSLILEPRFELLSWEVFYYIFLSFSLIFFCLLLTEVD